MVPEFSATVNAGGGEAVPHIISVIGAGANWTVTVDTGFSNGSVRLDLTNSIGPVPILDLQDTAGNEFNGVIEGESYDVVKTPTQLTSLFAAPCTNTSTSVWSAAFVTDVTGVHASNFSLSGIVPSVLQSSASFPNPIEHGIVDDHGCQRH